MSDQRILKVRAFEITSALVESAVPTASQASKSIQMLWKMSDERRKYGANADKDARKPAAGRVLTLRDKTAEAP